MHGISGKISHGLQGRLIWDGAFLKMLRPKSKKTLKTTEVYGILITCQDHIMDGFPSGQRGQTVNLLSTTSKVRILLHPYAGVAELADAQDLKSCGTNLPYRFDSGRRHKRRKF